MSYQAVIGLEVHLQLSTNSKLFSACPADYHGAEPNTYTDPYTLGLPGALPVANAKAVELALLFGLALGCDVEGYTEFHRKHYFYPDSPKNFQLSQYDRPIARAGVVQTSCGPIRIKRAHLEDDAGKLTHPTYMLYSLLDLNRCGSALIEMVTEADFVSGEQAREFLEEIQAIARALGVSEANPEEGKMRCDVNISVHRQGEPWGTKVEVKNLNSFRSVVRAIEHETQRQIRVLSAGGQIRQDTLGWDEGGQKTFLMRTKEGEADYRYLPEPDLPPLFITPEQVQHLRDNMPELPAQKRARYLGYGLKEADAALLGYDLSWSQFFDQAFAAWQSLMADKGTGTGKDADGTQGAQKLANWLLSEVAGLLGEQPLSSSALQPAHLAELLMLLETKQVSGRSAKDLLPEVMAGQSAVALVQQKGLVLVSDQGVIDEAIAQAMRADPDAVAQVRAGNQKAINGLFGPIMKQLGGQADPQVVRARLQAALKE